MIPDRMSRPLRVLLISISVIALAAFATACGTQRIKVPRSEGQLYRGAVLFSQRCSGCHTLSYAATHGSASNIRSAEITNGPNLDQRCERPVTRVLYAIQNGGFSGAIMPQNVVVGEDARDVAEFVSRFAGTQATKSPGITPCQSQPIGILPPPVATIAAATSPSTPPTTSTTAATGSHHAGAKAKARAKHKTKT